MRYVIWCIATVLTIAGIALYANAETNMCVGNVPDVIDNAVNIEQEDLETSALGDATKGGMCDADVFDATGKITVYRIYDSSRPWSMHGRWWSFDRPRGSKPDYREDNAICPEWSALDRIVMCDIEIDEEFVVGTTQSVQCENTFYPANDNLQVYIPNAENDVKVENCRVLRFDTFFWNLTPNF